MTYALHVRLFFSKSMLFTDFDVCRKEKSVAFN